MSSFLPRRAWSASAPLYLFRSLEEKLGLVALAIGMIFASAQTVLAHDTTVESLTVSQPWSRATPGGAKVASGYLVIRNTGDQPDRLIAATSGISGRTEIHEMAVKDGVMTMRPLADGLTVPAKGEIVLKPGSYHLMFVDLKSGLQEGEPFQAQLTFEKAGSVALTFDVRAIGASDAGDPAGHGTSTGHVKSTRH
ncbi:MULTISPECIES: copper chaperone PCu(A)C [unclassified Chelatococcus]|uniref:copper chaperone PCu(A)C n=1 Tax=unclassified Chelatococcus TaxID=2638111 RepID=UPI001BCB6728|nr:MULTISPECIES: copper chaperone PCu(A)C [unclassified Chelatococcus]MBS7701511.1 copper chaperone PCu(A)C [Chelatococcus sp. YT9]MBX3556878.1 copper chaperone PCu(A)C [Chelatococcus sp.]